MRSWSCSKYPHMCSRVKVLVNSFDLEISLLEPPSDSFPSSTLTLNNSLNNSPNNSPYYNLNYSPNNSPNNRCNNSPNITTPIIATTTAPTTIPIAAPAIAPITATTRADTTNLLICHGLNHFLFLRCCD